MINFALTEKLGKNNSEFQMGFEPTTLRDLVGCSTTELLETLVVEHPTRSRRVVGSNPIWNSEFFFPSFSVNAKFIMHENIIYGLMIR